MGRRWLCCAVLVFLQVMSWVSGTSRLLPPNSNAHPPGKTGSKEVNQTEKEGMTKVADYKEMKRIGSTPPNCERKCHGCSPCVAIQVPTISGHFSLQYANYLPEGWMCKCGPSFYSP